MSITTSELDADLLDIIAEYPQAFTFGGTSYVCAADDLSEGRRPVLAGDFGDDAVVIRARTAILPTVKPAAGDTLTYLSRTLRIVRVDTSVDGSMMTLTCEEKTA